MKNITVYLPIPYLKQIGKLVKKKIVPSRSEAVRLALREFLHREFKFLKRLGYFG